MLILEKSHFKGAFSFLYSILFLHCVCKHFLHVSFEEQFMKNMLPATRSNFEAVSASIVSLKQLPIPIGIFIRSRHSYSSDNFIWASRTCIKTCWDHSSCRSLHLKWYIWCNKLAFPISGLKIHVIITPKKTITIFATVESKNVLLL